MWTPESWRDLDRHQLAAQLTERARAAVPEADMEVLWKDGWVHRVGRDYFPDPSLLDGQEPDWPKIAGRAAKYFRDADDYWFHVYKPAAGDVIVDIGAGRGEDAFAFSRAVGPAGQVWAIEPHPVSFGILKQLCALNQLTNVRTLNYACMERRANLQIETMPVWESNYVREGAPSPTSHSVKAMPFDEVAANMGIGMIDFLKMNIEGAELHALPGCRRALARTRFVCIAAHDFRAARGEGEQFRTLAFVREFLRDCEFNLVTRDEDPRYYVPYHVHGVR